MKKVDNIYQNVKNPHFVKNPGESAGFFKKTQKNPPGPGFFKILAGFANPDSRKSKKTTPKMARTTPFGHFHGP